MVPASGLTKTLVGDLQTPEKGQTFVWDTEVPGFAVRVTPSGAKAWIVQMRVRGGKERRMTIGFCNKVPLDKARQEARKVLATADLGRDPAQERKEAREVKPDTDPTFAEFSTRWLTEVAERRNREGTLKNRRLLLKSHILPGLAEKRIGNIRRKDIEDMHHRISQSLPVAANRAVSLCSAIFSADVVRFLLLTGAGVGEVLAMQWAHVDLNAGLWVKPAATTKQKRIHRVPLSPAAVEVLAKRLTAQRTGRRRGEPPPWIFPGEGADGHMTTIRAFWAAVCRRAGIEGVRAHDVRHTFASLLVSSGKACRWSAPCWGILRRRRPAGTPICWMGRFAMRQIESLFVIYPDSVATGKKRLRVDS